MNPDHHDRSRRLRPRIRHGCDRVADIATRTSGINPGQRRDDTAGTGAPRVVVGLGAGGQVDDLHGMSVMIDRGDLVAGQDVDVVTLGEPRRVTQCNSSASSTSPPT